MANPTSEQAKNDHGQLTQQQERLDNSYRKDLKNAESAFESRKNQIEANYLKEWEAIEKKKNVLRKLF